MAGSLFRVKSIDSLIAASGETGAKALKRTLGPTALVALGMVARSLRLARFLEVAADQRHANRIPLAQRPSDRGHFIARYEPADILSIGMRLCTHSETEKGGLATALL